MPSRLPIYLNSKAVANGTADPIQSFENPFSVVALPRWAFERGSSLFETAGRRTPSIQTEGKRVPFGEALL